jgi:hypothetical protein
LITWSLLTAISKSHSASMRASPLDASTIPVLEEPETVREKPRGAPASRLFIKYSMIQYPGLSLAQALFDRGYMLYRRYVTNLIIGALFLWLSFIVLSFASDLFLQQSSPSLNLLCGSTLLLISMFFIASPGKHPTSFTLLIWVGLNVAFFMMLLYTAITNVIPIVRGEAAWGSLFIFLLTIGALVVYGVLAFVVSSTLRRQVAVHKPMQLLALWVFDSANNLISTLNGIGLIWQFLGTIQFLRGGELTVDLGELASKKRAELVVDTPEELRQRLQAFKTSPNWWHCERNTLLCGDKLKSAVQVLLEMRCGWQGACSGFRTNQVVFMSWLAWIHS